MEEDEKSIYLVSVLFITSTSVFRQDEYKHEIDVGTEILDASMDTIKSSQGYETKNSSFSFMVPINYRYRISNISIGGGMGIFLSQESSKE